MSQNNEINPELLRHLFDPVMHPDHVPNYLAGLITQLGLIFHNAMEQGFDQLAPQLMLSQNSLVAYAHGIEMSNPDRFVHWWDQALAIANTNDDVVFMMIEWVNQNLVQRHRCQCESCQQQAQAPANIIRLDDYRKRGFEA